MDQKLEQDWVRREEVEESLSGIQGLVKAMEDKLQGADRREGAARQAAAEGEPEGVGGRGEDESGGMNTALSAQVSDSSGQHTQASGQGGGAVQGVGHV